MKKTFLAIVLALILTLSLCSCGEKSGENSNSNVSSDEKVTSVEGSTTIAPRENKSSHYEYTHSALEGCVIVKSDKLTGQCVYKTKCPVCGKTSSGTTSTYRRSGILNSGSTCSNAQCSNWGKHFDVKIETTSQLVDD